MINTGGWGLFVSDYPFLFIAGLITVVLAIALRSPVVTGLQMLFIMVSFFIGGTNAVIHPILLLFQAVISLSVLYKYVKAVEMNEQLILEKTHQKAPHLIKEEHRGSRFSFWHTS
ncbi:hypothetical protein EU245_10265 [Lentibacillus lipolyticus]|nr:hypothetical protein EU245_10265 [Lentibacillus lipolyticus]